MKEGDDYMPTIVQLRYDSAARHTEICAGEQKMDTASLEGMKMEEWLYPFKLKNIRWKGIYEELSAFLGTEKYVVLFEGTAQDRKLLENVLADTPAKVSQPDSTVDIVYQREPLSTRISINGQPFDTSRLENRTIDQWVEAFEIGGKSWGGIFPELLNEIGTDRYRIRFTGMQEDMILLVNTCPDEVEITYQAKPQSGHALSDIGSRLSQMAAGAAANAGGLTTALSGAGNQLGQAVTDAAASIKESEKVQQVIQSDAVQNVMQSKAVQKAGGFWSKLPKAVRIAIPLCAVLLIVLAVILFRRPKIPTYTVDPGGFLAGVSKDQMPVPGGTISAGRLEMIATVYFRADSHKPSEVYLLESESGESKECTPHHSDINDFANKDADYDADVNGTDQNNDGYVDYTLSQFNGEEYTPICYLRVNMEAEKKE